MQFSNLVLAATAVASLLGQAHAVTEKLHGVVIYSRHGDRTFLNGNSAEVSTDTNKLDRHIQGVQGVSSD